MLNGRLQRIDTIQSWALVFDKNWAAPPSTIPVVNFSCNRSPLLLPNFQSCMFVYTNLALAFLWLSQCHAFVKPNGRVNSSSKRTILSLKATPANEGHVTIHRNNSQHHLAYRIARPMSLSSKQAAPILTLHGGPSLLSLST
jgi:hypothetical protein